MGFDPEHYRIVKKAAKKGEVLELKNAQLMGADLRHANLSGANLRRADLNGAALSKSNLVKAKLVGADLRNADLRNVDLSGADLSDSDLTDANLSHAVLKGAFLQGARLVYTNVDNADLHEADFRGADLWDMSLSNANFSGSIFGANSFSKLDLSVAIGLDSAHHKNSSEIGFNSFVISKNKIPKVFLKGCGLPDSYIDYIPSLIGSLNPIDFYSCFISHSHDDKLFVNRLHNDLQQEGVRCWVDDHQIKMGDDIDEEIERGIKLWDKTILCVSGNSLESDWVEYEVEKAFKAESDNNIKKIIPIDLDGAIKDWSGPIGTKLRKRLVGDFVDWDKDIEKYNDQFTRLVDALNTAAKQEPPPQKNVGGRDGF